LLASVRDKVMASVTNPARAEVPGLYENSQSSTEPATGAPEMPSAANAAAVSRCTGAIA
jgi:hypothetical protein